MHKLHNWRAARSGPRMTISGYVDGGGLMKVPAISIQGPDATRLQAPAATIAIRPDGQFVELA